MLVWYDDGVGVVTCEIAGVGRLCSMVVGEAGALVIAIVGPGMPSGWNVYLLRLPQNFQAAKQSYRMWIGG